MGYPARHQLATAMEFEELRQGDFVKARVGNERLWFTVLALVPNAVVCTLASQPVGEVYFDGRCTLDKAWVMDAARKAAPPNLQLISSN